MAKISAEVTIGDYSKELLEKMKEQVQLGLAAIGAEAEGFAKEECPVDTGRLRNSIAWATSTEHSFGGDAPQGTPDDGEVYIGSNVEYAAQVEFLDRGHRTGNAHFLRNAVTDHDARYKEIMEMMLKSGM